jgi:hypothetical protein
MGVSGQRHALAALPGEEARYQLYRRLGGPQGRSGRVRKVSSPPEFDPRTVQPAASRYTDCAVPAHPSCRSTMKIKMNEDDVGMMTVVAWNEGLESEFLINAKCILWEEK